MCLFIIPSLAKLGGKRLSSEQQIPFIDRSIIFIPVPSFQQQGVTNDPARFLNDMMNSRMINKLIALILIGMILTLQYSVLQELIPFPQQDLW